MSVLLEPCSPLATMIGMLGASAALGLANLGAAYGTVKSGVGVAHLGMVNKSRSMRGMVPVVMAGILGIYGLIIAVIITNNVKTTVDYTVAKGCVHLGAGLAGGFASLAAGYAIGIVGEACTSAYQRTETIFVVMILMLIFAEALGLYGLIVALLMNNTAAGAGISCDKAPWQA
eukprot:TRINITY_DN32061_c0_g1_i1.p2 TRINITY_DN32061_c0_g1~~TRINITY_DN32061_c0_g1_i1.p2  ORF type:complete len:174 (+),score=41.93 TRINITY_DN32061_c0_g1_i1:53-574(+)